MLLFFFFFFFFFFFVTIFRVGFLSVAYLTVAHLPRLGISVHCYVLVFSQAPLLVLDYRWLHNPPTYQRIVTPNWYRTHTVPQFGLQSSWITYRCMPLHPAKLVTVSAISDTWTIRFMQNRLWHYFCIPYMLYDIIFYSIKVALLLHWFEGFVHKIKKSCVTKLKIVSSYYANYEINSKILFRVF